MRFLERRPVAQVLVHQLAATQPFALLLWLLPDLRHMGALVRDIAAERFGQLLAVAGEDLRIMRSARDGDVRHAVVDEVFRSQLCIDVNENAVGFIDQVLAGHRRQVVQAW